VRTSGSRARARARVTCTCTILILATLAHADPTADRVAHLDQALTAIRALGATGRDKLERDVYTAARTQCHAESSPPAPSCLADAASALCHGDPACEAAADVAVANARAANDWIDEATRAQLVRSSIDYRAALSGELHKRFAALAAELALTGERGAAGIDRLCRERDRAVHACTAGDATCVPSLPWSRCAAALLWFVASTRGPP